MKNINKKNEPTALKEFRSSGGNQYEELRGTAKEKLRDALFDEQQGLCCYCMGSIKSSAIGMKIEHWQSQKKYPDLQLNYSNLLGACRGNDHQPRKFQHCDTRKGDADLSYNPANSTHAIESRIFYELNGRIRSNEKKFDQELNEVLNLNLRELMYARQRVLKVVRDWYKSNKRRQPQKRVPESQVQRKIEENLPNHGVLKPFSHIAVWWLQKKLSK